MNKRILYDPKGRRYEVTYDYYGIVDTIVRDGRVLTNTNRDAQVILRNGDDLLYNPHTAKLPTGWRVP